MRCTHYITGTGDLSTPIHTMPDTRERCQQQTHKGTAEEKDILESVVCTDLSMERPCLSEIHPSAIRLLVG